MRKRTLQRTFKKNHFDEKFRSLFDQLIFLSVLSWSISTLIEKNCAEIYSKYPTLLITLNNHVNLV